MRRAFVAAGLLAGAVALAATGAYVFFGLEGADRPETAQSAAPAPAAQPGAAPAQVAQPKTVALYCTFYVFVESRPFVAFLLDKDQANPLRYQQVYVQKGDGDTTDYNELMGERPAWRFDGAAEPPRLSSTVMVPDSRAQAGVSPQDIAIEVRGFDGEAVGATWYEASLKSIYYQNLPGKCQQAQGPS
ncbi:hypothetical protein ACFQ4O_03940 [Methylopila musalis]|uniref:DUF1254 domain-containing protein n=1 Tax=Methylopila musalis TaxID=1134781 RepID=A0ABW3Z4F4_9HYPH